MRGGTECGTVTKSLGEMRPTMSELSEAGESEAHLGFSLSGLKSTLRKAQHHL